MEQDEDYGGDETSRLTRPWPKPLGHFPAQQNHSGKSDVRNVVNHRFRLQDTVFFEDDRDSVEKKIWVGICAMAKKSNSRPMKEIIRRLENFSRLQILIFDEDIILNHPVEDWPVVNAFISFFSSGFPLDKAIAYKNLRHPFVVNDLEMQKCLQDRTEVYNILQKNGIPHPRYTVLNKEKDPSCKVTETDDSIEINGQLHSKPFVEKPVDAEDHNVYIYFPQSAGGGSTRLFRKVKDRSSVYSHISNVRTDGAFLYEDFMPTDGTDVKVYTVGSDYQHAEGRKSPCLDGKVERDENGKEVRYPVILSAREKLIARRVVCAFGQNVCGFDLLRTSGKCYVCDVNGFSFVKTSNKYYDDCARILGTMMLRELCPTLHLPIPMSPAPEDVPVVPTTSGEMMELRCVVALVRHGDRTPKQKMKMEVKNKLFFELFERHGGFKKGHLKLKHPEQLQEVLDIVRELLTSETFCSSPDIQEKRTKLEQIKVVLEMYKFSGINRKIQIKYQPHGLPCGSSSDEFNVQQCSLLEDQRLWAQKITSPSDSTESTENALKGPSLVLIMKWGGELTPAGRIQAENLGKAFRTLYPGGQGAYEAPGLGFLRLHSTFRHDLKIYSSDEGRVQMTAAAFTKGLLALEGELTPIVVQMVKSSNTNGMLDGGKKTSKTQLAVKEKLQYYFNRARDFTEFDRHMLNPTNTLALNNAMDFVKNPREMCQRVYQMIQEITAKIRSLEVVLKTRDLLLYNGETWELLIRRWAKLEKDFPLKNGQFQISKIPDIYDCIKYDLQHNLKTLQYDRAQELFMCCKALADIVIPQEYGITVDEKLHIAQNYCSTFLCKIRSDFMQAINPSIEDDATRLDSRKSKGVASPERFVRSRMYFSSESHLHSTLNMLRYGHLFEIFQPESDSQWERALSFLDASAELNYMSQIVFMLFENSSKDLDSDERYHMELHFSPGAYTSCDEPHKPLAMGFRTHNCRKKKNSTEPQAAHTFDAAPFLNTQPLSLAANSEVQYSSTVKSPTDPSKRDPDYSNASSATLKNEIEEVINDKSGHVPYKVFLPPMMTSPSTDTDNRNIWSLFNTPRIDSSHVIQPMCYVGTGGRLSSASLPDIRPDRKSPDSATDENTSPAQPYPRNYKTVSLVLHNVHDSHQSLPSMLPSVLPTRVKGLYRYYTHPLEKLRLTYVEPFFNYQALEGFSNVPQVYPLETLHNTLTYQKMDTFLDRVINTHFPVPANNPASSHNGMASAEHGYLTSWQCSSASVFSPLSFFMRFSHKDEAPSHSLTFRVADSEKVKVDTETFHSESLSALPGHSHWMFPSTSKDKGQG